VADDDEDADISLTTAADGIKVEDFEPEDFEVRSPSAYSAGSTVQDPIVLSDDEDEGSLIKKT
jgi:hypothetical protein